MEFLKIHNKNVQCNVVKKSEFQNWKSANKMSSLRALFIVSKFSFNHVIFVEISLPENQNYMNIIHIDKSYNMIIIKNINSS